MTTDPSPVPRAVRPIDIEHDQLMARAEAEHQARVAADTARETAVRARVLHDAAVFVEAMNEGCGQTGCGACTTREDVADALRDTASRLAAEQPTETQASTAPLAAGLPLVKGRCPACGRASLFLGNGGYVTCSVIECAEPDAASTLLEPAEPWLTDSARIGRTLIWSWTDVGKGAFREGYQAAQAEARALLGGGRGTDPGQPAVEERPYTQTPEARLGRCSAVMRRVHHAPHGWAPQPGMDPVHCPGYPQPAP